MIRIRQELIPDYSDGVDEQTAEVETLDQLLAIEWIHSWTQDPDFDHWAQRQLGGATRHVLLMAIMKKAHWVVGYVRIPSEEKPLDLPLWTPEDAARRRFQ